MRNFLSCTRPLQLGLFALAACSDQSSVDLGTLQTTRMSPELPSETLSVSKYGGTNDIVQSAQELYYDGFALHANVIQPTCGPINGVCHNAKEYPDLHTPANFVGAISAPCNIQSGSPAGIYDRCERPGDRLKLSEGNTELEIGYLEYIAGEYNGGDDATPDAMSPGLHIYLAGKVNSDRASFRADAQFIRTFVNEDNVEDLPFFTLSTRFYVVDGDGYQFNDGDEGTHLLAEVRNYQQRDLESLLSVGVVEGDANHNGVLGARSTGNPIHMITPGKPEESYLVGRMRGTLGGEPVPGSRMPLANEPLNNVKMLALYCFIEGLADRPGPVNMRDPIDYEDCSFAQRPEDLELLGAGVSWNGRVRRILEFNCGGCHSGDNPAADLNLKDGDVFARILEMSSQVSLKLVEPGQPLQSYLWLKLNGDPSIVGTVMPVDPLNGDRRLSTQELADIKTWIEEGALPGGEDPLAPMMDAGMMTPPVTDAGPQPTPVEDAMMPMPPVDEDGGVPMDATMP